MKPNILLVEDVAYNIDILINVLKDDYRVLVATRGHDAMTLASSQHLDLILMDINLPDDNGIRIMSEIRDIDGCEQVPVIFISGINDPQVKNRCFEMGAADYITKPYNALEINRRLKHHLQVVEAHRLLASQKNILEEMVKTKTTEVLMTRDAAISAVSSLVETRDSETCGHINRTKNYVLIIAETLKIMGKYTDFLNFENINELERASPLHDIGKIGIPDKVLLKPGKLTDEEFETIKGHTIIGYQALSRAKESLGKNSFFDMACDIAKYHHEKWNGTGYPEGLIGEAIPLSARIMALADVYDALTSERVYKKAFEHDVARNIIIKDKGQHFDPSVVEAFLISEKLFEKIAFQSNEHSR